MTWALALDLVCSIAWPLGGLYVIAVARERWKGR